MEGPDVTQFQDLMPLASHDAIRDIVQVFQDGYRAVSALRRTATDLTAMEIESEIYAIELRMLSQISTICDDCLAEIRSIPKN